MTKIKTFVFTVANFKRCSEDDNLDTKKAEEKIDNKINDFLKDKNYIDLKINSVDVSTHNMVGDNFNPNIRNHVKLYYSIIYTDKVSLRKE